MKAHEFQYVARQFRAGKISLNDFTDKVFKAVASSDVVESSASESKSNQSKSTRPTRPGPGSPKVVEPTEPTEPLDPVSRLRKLSNRKLDTHKGDYGRVLVVAGSPGMAGAAGLTGLAALRSGAGLVSVATDSRCQATVAGFHPALMTIGLPLEEGSETALVDSYRCLESYDKRHDCLAIGPGAGKSLPAQGLMRALITKAGLPAIVDADAINALTDDFDFEESQSSPLVLTPHPGEMFRLMPDPSMNRDQQETFAVQFARPDRIVVLKGHQTLITNGEQKVYNSTGNPGMATAGSGDVLTGVIAALVGQGLSIWEAAVTGVFVHGQAGDHAAKQKSQVSLVASDIIDALPSVFCQ